MGINESFIAELQQEVQATKKLLERVPLDKADWKPHEKSMSLGRLAFHVAEIPGWTTVTLDSDGIDFAKHDYKPVTSGTTEELLKCLDDNYNKAMKSLNEAPDNRFMENWTMRTGDTVYFTLPKIAVLRSFSYNHWYHHRAQLGVYLRLLDVAVPGIYGPTADEQM
jgi:uncharacterized damage-inducible protein DinB